MKLAYLEEADQESVVHVVRDLLKERGALITEFTHNHVRFQGLSTGAYTFAKGGAVGVYQRVGEKEVQVRLRVEATIPARVFWRTVTMELLVGLLVFILNPSPEVYTLAAVLLWGGLLLTFFMYLGTWRSSWVVERDLLRDIVDALRHRADASTIELEEDRSVREFEENLDAEVARARLAETRKASKPAKTPGSLLAGLKARAPQKERAERPAGDKKPGLKERLKGLRTRQKDADASGEPSEEDSEDKRARIEALRAEIERRQRERQA